MLEDTESEIEVEACVNIREKDSITNLETTIQSAKDRISRNRTSISHIMSELDKVQGLFKRFNKSQYDIDYNDQMLRSISSDDVTDNYNGEIPEKLKQTTCENVKELSEINKTIEKSVNNLN